MSHDPLVQSIRSRLRNHARDLGVPFQEILVRYGIERFLYRIQQSSRNEELVLKGATLFLNWTDELHRPTKDADFLVHGEPGTTRLEELVRDILRTDVQNDGLTFDFDSIEGEEIRHQEVYAGVRVSFDSFLGTTEISLRIDAGFGDVITPGAEIVELPRLLEDFSAPSLRAYPRETTIAEKFESMVSMGAVNSRMKDFYDVWRLTNTFEFEGERLASAISATFDRRKTDLPEQRPVALREAFAEEPNKTQQWSNFVNELRPGFPDPGLRTVLHILGEFLWPPTSAARANTKFRANWLPDTGWTGQNDP